MPRRGCHAGNSKHKARNPKQKSKQKARMIKRTLTPFKSFELEIYFVLRISNFVLPD